MPRLLRMLFHPESFGDAKIQHPLAAAKWNSVVGTIVAGFVAVAIVLLRGYTKWIGFVSVRNLAYVEVGLIAMCTVHAFLGARVGARKAASVLALILVLVIGALIYFQALPQRPAT